MSVETTPQAGWSIPEGYYDKIAGSNVSSSVHLLGRLGVGALTFVQCGRPIIERSEGFNLMQPELKKGNVIISSAHRSGWETVRQPAVFEKVGLHHARPVSKEENMQNRFIRWGMHGLGSFAIDRNHADLDGLTRANTGILQRGGIVTFYSGGSRKYKDVLVAEQVLPGIIFSAANNKSLIVPTAVAGMSKELRGEKGNYRVIASDRGAKFGRGPKLVHAFGTPFRLEDPGFELIPNRRKISRQQFSAQREYIEESAIVIQNEMQVVLNRAYEVRGSSLDEKTEEYEEEQRAKLAKEAEGQQ